MNKDFLEIRRFLGSVRRWAWGIRLTSGLLRLGMIAGIVVILNTVLLEVLPGSPWLIFGIGILGTLAFWICAIQVLLGSMRPISWRRAARRVEDIRPEFGSDVVSSLDLSQTLEAGAVADSTSRSLILALIGRTRDRVKFLRSREFVSWRPIKTWGVWFFVILLTMPLVAHLGPGLSGAALKAVVDPRVHWPLGKITIDVNPGPARIARGDDLLVEARIAGPHPSEVRLDFKAEGESVTSVPMRREAEDTYVYQLERVMRAFRYRVFAGAASSPWFPVEVVDPPTAGNFEITYNYPAYTGLESRRVSGGGDLEALRGTGVEITFAVNKELSRGRLLLGENEYVVSPAGPQLYQVSFYLNSQTTYRLVLQDREGFENRDRLEYHISYIPDAVPTVEVLAPRGEVEMDFLSQVAVTYRAADDFGISRLTLVYRSISGEEKREQIASGPSGKKLEGDYSWDVGELEASPGDVIPAYLEVADNDTISGPKVGVSSTFSLRISDPREKHREVETTLSELTDDLVDLLGDELDLLSRYQDLEADAEEWEAFPWEKLEEAVVRQESLRGSAEQAAEKVSSLTRQIAQDPLSWAETYYQMELLSRGMDALRNRTLEPMSEIARNIQPSESDREEVLQKTDFLSSYMEEAVRDTEQMILMAEEMKREQKMADVQEAGQEMVNLQNKLLESLDRLSPEDRKALDEALQDLARVEEMLQELIETLSRDIQELPEDFLNSDALQNLPLQDLLQGIKEIREKIMAGDIDGAKKAVQELLKDLNELLNRLRQAGEDFEERAGQSLSRLRDSSVPELEKIIQEQRSILQRTEALEKMVAPRLEEALRQRAAEEGDSPGEAGPSLTEVGFMTEKEKAQAAELSQGEGGLRRRTEQLAQEVAALKSVLPFLDPEIESSLERAGTYMGEAQEILAEFEPGTALAPERSALAEMMRARDGANRSLQEMGRMQGLRRGKTGVPAFLVRSGRMPQGVASSAPTRGMRSGGRLGTDIRSFRIPGKEEYQVPRIFRQEILKSLREGYPAPYEDRIKDYYQRITE